MKGLIGELEFTSHLLKKGYSILKPLNPNTSYDIVAEKNNKYVRIQIKYLTPRNGLLRVEMNRPKKKKRTYRQRGVDAIGVFDSINRTFYLITITTIKNKSEFWLRIDKAKNQQKKNINFAKKYII